LKAFVYILAILLAVAHQDFWWWTNGTLLLGFMPVGLAYHALYSILCAIVWGLAVKFAWPTEVEAFLEQDTAAAGAATTAAEAISTDGTAEGLSATEKSNCP